MKMRCKWLYLCMSVLVVFSMSKMVTNAMNTGFSTKELSEERRDSFAENVNISSLSKEPVHKSIQCFDVNEKGMVAIGQQDVYGTEVCVYNSSKEFLYGYSIDINQSFGLEWDDNYINIYLVRSDVIISMDSAGNILDVKQVDDTIENNTYGNELLYSTSRSVGNKTYLLRNNMGILNWIATSYSQIVTVDDTGTETIIYDVNSTQLLRTTVILIIVLGVFVSSIVFLVRKYIAVKHKV